MSKQTQGSLLLVAMISGGIFVVAFLALMLVGGYTVSPAAFLALVVAGAVGLFLFLAFHQKPLPPPVSASRQRDESPAMPAAAPVSAPAPAPEPAPPVEAAAPEPAPAPEPTPAPAAAPAPAGEARRPSAMAAPEGEADDLKKIKGVGPKLEKLLNSMGFYHYHQVAAWTGEEVAWVDDNLEGFKGRVSRDEWVDQAKILAAGGETEFSRRAG